MIWCPSRGCGRNLGPTLARETKVCGACGAIVRWDGERTRALSAHEVDRKVLELANRIRRTNAAARARKAASS